MRSGIYAIIHRASARWYVGQSQEPAHRWSNHQHHLRRGRHHSKYLQSAWNKYGPDAFTFEILILAPVHLLNDLEQAYLDDPETSHFNVARCAEAPARGLRRPPRTPEHRAAISAAARGRKLPPGRKMPPLTPEHRAKQSASLKAFWAAKRAQKGVG